VHVSSGNTPCNLLFGDDVSMEEVYTENRELVPRLGFREPVALIQTAGLRQELDAGVLSKKNCIQQGGE
jgi:hypothetical protein